MFMKKIFSYLPLLLALCFAAQDAYAQKEIKKRDLKAIKQANKEAKKRQKEGWYTPVGSIPMAKVLEQAWAYELELKEDGSPKYLMATGSATSGTKAAGDQAALTAARNELASAISAKVSELIQTKRATDQIDQATANTLDKTVSNSKTLVQAELTNVKTAYKIYKDVEANGRKNVMVEAKIFYNQDEAMRTAQKVIRRELEKESNELGKQLDDILGIGEIRRKNNETPAEKPREKPNTTEISVNISRTTEHREEVVTRTTEGCENALNSSAFSNFKEEIKEITFEDNRMKIAKKLTKNVCLSKAQIKEITQIFAFENTRIEYLKYAYDFCYDKQDYYQLGNVLNFSKTKDELNDFLKDK
jgi:hypothetical protein